MKASPEISKKRMRDPKRLVRDAYTAFYDIALDTRFLRYPDYHHLDNVSIALIHDTARVRFCANLDNRPVEESLDGRLIASITLTYLAEVARDAAFSVGCTIADIGRSSFGVNQALFVDGVCVGLCDAVMVNATAKGVLPLKAGVRKVLRSLCMEGAAAT